MQRGPCKRSENQSGACERVRIFTKRSVSVCLRLPTFDLPRRFYSLQSFSDDGQIVFHDAILYLDDATSKLSWIQREKTWFSPQSISCFYRSKREEKCINSLTRLE